MAWVLMCLPSVCSCRCFSADLRSNASYNWFPEMNPAETAFDHSSLIQNMKWLKRALQIIRWLQSVGLSGDRDWAV